MNNRIVFLDCLRVIAIFMVLAVHSCEQYYFGADGSFLIGSLRDALSVTAIDSAVRACVPLFVMASAYLLFPVTRPTGEFFRRRLLRVGVPYLVWCCVYVAYYGGSWAKMLFNFPASTGGHLWFVPMLFGLYLLMPLLSPWAVRVTERELKGWIALWFVTTLFPFVRFAFARLFGCGWSHAFGLGDFGALPFLYGECAWNPFGTFHYLSGFVGYMLLGLWFRKFARPLSWRETLARAIPLWVVGWLVTAGFFFFRIPSAGGYPAKGPYSLAVELEMSWEFCSLGVALTVVAYFLLVRKLNFAGAFYARLVRPLAEASFGVYLVHMLVLAALAPLVRAHFANPAAIFVLAFETFVLSSLAVLLLRRIPKLGRVVGAVGPAGMPPQPNSRSARRC